MKLKKPSRLWVKIVLMAATAAIIAMFFVPTISIQATSTAGGSPVEYVKASAYEYCKGTLMSEEDLIEATAQYKIDNPTKNAEVDPVLFSATYRISLHEIEEAGGSADFGDEILCLILAYVMIAVVAMAGLSLIFQILKFFSIGEKVFKFLGIILHSIFILVAAVQVLGCFLWYSISNAYASIQSIPEIGPFITVALSILTLVLFCVSGPVRAKLEKANK